MNPLGAKNNPSQLRQAAETRLRGCGARPPTPPKTEADLRRLQHELEVHQVELEMQNEELRAARAKMEAEAQRYTDLFDFAPVGYFSLIAEGVIRLVNLKASEMLGVERAQLAGRSLQNFLVKTDRPAFRQFLRQTFSTGGRQYCEISLLRNDGQPLNVSLESNLIAGAEECRIIMQDITGRKQMDEALQRSEELYRLTELATQDGLWDWNILTDEEYFSPRYEEIIGLGRGDMPRQKSAFLGCLHPDDLPAVKAVTSEHLRTGSRYAIEFRLRHQDGGYRWVFSRGEAVRDASGRPVRMVGVITDITERKRLETEMARTNHWLINTQRISKVGGWSFNLKTGAVWVSPEALRIYGAKAEAPLTIPMIQSFPLAQYRPRLNAALEDLLAGRAPYDVEFQIARGDDGAIVDIHSVAEYDAAESVVMGVFEDITARKQAELSLRASEARYRNIVETSEEGVWMVDAGWRTTFTNRRLEQMFGYEPGKMLGRPVSDFMDEPGVAAAGKLEQRREQGLPETHDFKFIRQNGEALWTMIATNPVLDDAGVFTGALAMVTDITTRKQQQIFSEIGRAVLQILNEPCGLKASIHRVVAALKQLTGFDAVGIRLRAGHDFPYFAQEGFSDDFLLTENSLVERTPEGGLCRDPQGQVALECTCGLVLSGQTKRDHPWFTAQGSFWTNDSPALLGLPPAEDPRRHPRNRCIHQGYASVLLVPIRNRDRILGLIQFNVRRKGCFTFKIVEQMEEIAGQIGLSLVRMQAEAALRESEEKFAKMFQSSPVAISLSTLREGRLLNVNEEYLRMTERTKDEVIGRTSFELGLWTNPDHRAVLVEKLSQKSCVRNVELDLRSKSGRVHHVLWSGEELLMQGERCVLGSALDITEHKEAERGREQERKLLRTLIDHIPDMIYVRDVANRFLIANQAFARYMGVATTAELVGRTDADFYPPETAAQYAATDRKVFGGFELINYDCLIHYPNGETLNILNTKIPLQDDEGKVIGLVGVCRDITERRKLEEHLRQAQKMEAIGTLAGGIAHDFNNILGAMFGYAHLLEQDTEDNPLAQESIREILNAANRAKELVQQILTFSRQREQRPQVIKLDLIVREAIKFLRASLPANLQIDLDLAPDTPAVLADPTQVYQVTMNLATNALHAMEDRPGCLTVSLEGILPEPGLIQAHPELKPVQYVRLTVADTGSGMDAKTLERIFEPFFTTKPVGKGTGLGLAMVHGIMQALSGAITVESQVGRGSTFRLYFPAQALEVAGTEAVSQAIPQGSGEQILVVDDEPVLALLLEKHLVRMNYQPTAINRAADALRLIRENPTQFDLVITDLTMPELNGLDLARAIHAIRPDLPVLLTTGYSASLTPDKLRAAGVEELIEKPISPANLAEAVRRSLH